MDSARVTVHRERAASLLLILASALWGSSFIASKICLNSGLLPFETVFYRSFLGAGSMFILFRCQLAGISAKAVYTGIAMGLISSASFTFEMYGISMTEASKAALLVATNIVMVPFLYALFFRRRLPLNSVFSAVLALVGVAVLTVSRDTAWCLAPGDILLLSAAVMYALGSIVSAKWGTLYPTVQVTFIQLLTLTISMGFMTCLQGQAGHCSMDSILAILYLAIGPTLICFWIKNYAMCHVPPIKCTLILATQSIFCVLFSLLIFREVFTLKRLMGMLLILLSIVIEQAGGHLLLQHRQVGTAHSKTPKQM